MHVLFAVLTFTMFAIGSSLGCGGKIDVCTRAEQYLAACGSTRARPECRVDAEAQCRAECALTSSQLAPSSIGSSVQTRAPR